MSDLISRQAAIDALCKDSCGSEWCGVSCHEVVVIETLPSAKPEVAIRIVGKSRDGMTQWYQCGMCTVPVDAQDNFCRGCGRRLIDEL